MDTALREIMERRRAAVQQFIEDTANLWATSEAEREDHAKNCTDEDCTFSDASVPTFEDGWMFIIRQVPMDDSGSEQFVKVTSNGLTWSRQLGFCEYVRDALEMG